VLRATEQKVNLTFDQARRPSRLGVVRGGDDRKRREDRELVAIEQVGLADDARLGQLNKHVVWTTKTRCVTNLSSSWR